MLLTCCQLSQASPRVILTPPSPRWFKSITLQDSTTHFPSFSRIHRLNCQTPQTHTSAHLKDGGKQKTEDLTGSPAMPGEDNSKWEEKEGSAGKLSHCHAAKPIGGWCCWAIGVKMKWTPSQRNPAPGFSRLPEPSLERKRLHDPPEPSTSHFAQGWHCQCTCGCRARSRKWQGLAAKGRG